MWFLVYILVTVSSVIGFLQVLVPLFSFFSSFFFLFKKCVLCVFMGVLLFPL